MPGGPPASRYAPYVRASARPSTYLLLLPAWISLMLYQRPLGVPPMLVAACRWALSP